MFLIRILFYYARLTRFFFKYHYLRELVINPSCLDLITARFGCGSFSIVYTLGFPIFFRGLDYILTTYYGMQFLMLLPRKRFSYLVLTNPF